MTKKKALLGAITVSALVAACSGGSNSDEDRESASAPAAAPAAAAGTPAADDVTTLDGTKLASFTGNAVNGKVVFGQCRSCHVTDPGVNKNGPSLAGIIGRKSGSVPGFSYSPANASNHITWTKEKLFQFLEKPQRVVPQTKMVFVGLPDAQKRADVIAYLENPN